MLQGENGTKLSYFRSGTHYVITVTLNHNSLLTATAELADWNYTEAEVTLGGDPSYRKLVEVSAATTDINVLMNAIIEAYEKGLPLKLTGTELAMDGENSSLFEVAFLNLSGEVPTGSNDLILSDVTELLQHAFYSCTVLRSVSALKVTTIGKSAFYGCTALTSISLSAATEIGEEAFSGCTALPTVALPAATTIGKKAFYGCTALTGISLPAATTIEGRLSVAASSSAA